MIERIRSNWNARAEAGETMVEFTIMRDGQIGRKMSGFAALDINAQRALLVARQLPALHPTLTVHLGFHAQDDPHF
jgi:hypothetical protein